jgi:hypothetical protein
VAVLVAGVGIVTCLFVFVFGLLPPDQIALLSVSGYESVLIGGIIITCLAPIFIAHYSKASKKMLW